MIHASNLLRCRNKVNLFLDLKNCFLTDSFCHCESATKHQRATVFEKIPMVLFDSFFGVFSNLFVLQHYYRYPKIQSLDNKLAFASLVVCIYFLIIMLRTHVICYQTKHGFKQTFDRACPEWITLLFFILAYRRTDFRQIIVTEILISHLRAKPFENEVPFRFPNRSWSDASRPGQDQFRPAIPRSQNRN